MIYNNDYLPGIHYEDFETPLEERCDPNYTPRPQRDYDNELNNRRTYAPIDSTELDDLRADAEVPLVRQRRGRPTTRDDGEQPSSPPQRDSTSPPSLKTRSGRSVSPVQRLTVNQVSPAKHVRIPPTELKLEH